jgi:hypothetical protein
MNTMTRPTWFLLLRAPLKESQPEASIERWLTALFSKQWRVPQAASSLRRAASGLLFRWGDGAERDDRWSFVDLERGATRADGTVTIAGPDLVAARLELTVVNATPDLARATFIALALAMEDAVGILCEVGVGSSAAEELGAGGATEVGWLTAVPGDRTGPGPYHRVEPLDSGTLVEAYTLEDAAKLERLREVEAWLRTPTRDAASAVPRSRPPAGAPTPALAAPSYLLASESKSAPAGQPLSRPMPPASVPAAPPLDAFAPSSGAVAPSTATEPLDLVKIRAALAAGAVPFAGKTSPERLAALRDAAPSVEADPTVEADADSTMFMPTAASRAIASEAADFARDLREVPIPDLSIDHYAALSVEIELKGATPDVLRRHGIPSSASLEALQAEQGRRMLADPALRRAFDERRAHFLSFAQGQRR